MSDKHVLAADDDNTGNVDTVKMKIKVKDDMPFQATYCLLPEPLHQKFSHYMKNLLKRK